MLCRWEVNVDMSTLRRREVVDGLILCSTSYWVAILISCCAEAYPIVLERRVKLDSGGGDDDLRSS